MDCGGNPPVPSCPRNRVTEGLRRANRRDRDRSLGNIRYTDEPNPDRGVKQVGPEIDERELGWLMSYVDQGMTKGRFYAIIAVADPACSPRLRFRHRPRRQFREEDGGGPQDLRRPGRAAAPEEPPPPPPDQPQTEPPPVAPPAAVRINTHADRPDSDHRGHPATAAAAAAGAAGAGAGAAAAAAGRSAAARARQSRLLFLDRRLSRRGAPLRGRGHDALLADDRPRRPRLRLLGDRLQRQYRRWTARPAGSCAAAPATRRRATRTAIRLRATTGAASPGACRRSDQDAFEFFTLTSFE